MRRFLVLALSLLALSWLAAPPAHAEDGVTEVCRFSDSRLTEMSGLAWSPSHPGVLWTHNDSGGGPYIYAIDAKTCKTLARVRIAGIPARDIEAIAPGRDKLGRPVLWIADIGDNNDSWPYVRIHRVREPATIASVTVPAKTYRVRYADRPHNAETLLADPKSQQLWIVTKQLAHGSLYVLPKKLSTSGINVAKPIRVEGGLVTDGAVSPDGSRYVLRDYVNGTMFDGLPPGRNRREFPLPFQLQGEAITWTPDGKALLVASERDNRLLRVELPPSVRIRAGGTGIARLSG
ncbi:MAG: hypothetical protein WCP95_06475 [Actinomycetes bacterium]